MSITIERFEGFPCRAEIALRKKRAWIDPGAEARLLP